MGHECRSVRLVRDRSSSMWKSLKASTLVFESGYDPSLQRTLEGRRTWILVYLYPNRIPMRIPSARRPRGPSDDPAATGVGKAVGSRYPSSRRTALRRRDGRHAAAVRCRWP